MVEFLPKDVAEMAGIRVERGGEYIYVYLDTPEAIKTAPSFLPPTQRGVAPDGKEVWVYRDSGKAGWCGNLKVYEGGKQ